MKRIQDALATTGIPAYAGVWRPTAEYKSPPPQYLVYSTLIIEDDHMDDILVRYKLYVYLNLWSTGDVTEWIRKVRAAMRAAGFQMQDETDRGYNQPAYNTDADLFSVFWTWVLRVDAAEEDGQDEYEA